MRWSTVGYSFTTLLAKILAFLADSLQVFPQIWREKTANKGGIQLWNYQPFWASFLMFALLSATCKVFLLLEKRLPHVLLEAHVNWLAPACAPCAPDMFNFIGFLNLGTVWNVNATTRIVQSCSSVSAIEESRRYGLVGEGSLPIQSLPNKFYYNHEVIILYCRNLYSTSHTWQSSVRTVLSPRWKQGCTSRLGNAC